MNMKILLFFCLFSAVACFARANNNMDVINDGMNSDVHKMDISGGVINADTKKPINNVNVTVISTDTKEKWVTSTDQNGNFSFNSLKGGTYKVVFQKDGFKKIIKEKVWIKEDQNFQVNTEMSPTGDFQVIPGLLLFDHSD